MIEVKVDTAALSKLIDDLGEGFDDEVVEAMDTSVRFPTIPCASQVVLHMGDTRSRTIPPLRPCPSPCLRYWWPLMGHRSPSMDRWGRVKQPLRAMQPRAVADAIRSRAAAAGIDRASGHSLRVGAAVSMAQRGASLASSGGPVIDQLGHQLLVLKRVGVYDAGQGVAEDVGVVAVVEPPLKFFQIAVHVLGTHLAAADVDDMAVMQQAIDECSGHDLVAQDLAPLFEAFIGGQHSGCALIAPVDELEEEHGAPYSRIVFAVIALR